MASDDENIRRGWLAAARQWTADTAGRVMEPWRSARMTPNGVWVLSAQGQWVEQLQTNVRPPILGALRRAVQAVTGSAPPAGFDQSQYVSDYLAQSINRMSNTPDQVYREITRTLDDGIAAGESTPELAARVQAVFDVTGNPFWENRATVVGRTEAHAAVQAGTLAGAAQQQIETRRPLMKVWHATLGQPERTRPAHAAAHGQAQPLTSPFIVDGEKLQYPGDPTGSAGNVIQCRCTMTFREA